MTIEKLVEIGGKEWKVSDKHRVYFNLDFMAEAIGLDLSFYKTGNICSASLDGEKISNSKANKILRSLDGKFWYDVKEDKFFMKEMDRELAKQVKEYILSRV
jgi:hypothetical protein